MTFIDEQRRFLASNRVIPEAFRECIGLTGRRVGFGCRCCGVWLPTIRGKAALDSIFGRMRREESME